MAGRARARARTHTHTHTHTRKHARARPPPPTHTHIRMKWFLIKLTLQPAKISVLQLSNKEPTQITPTLINKLSRQANKQTTNQANGITLQHFLFVYIYICMSCAQPITFFILNVSYNLTHLTLPKLFSYCLLVMLYRKKTTTTKDNNKNNCLDQHSIVKRKGKSHRRMSVFATYGCGPSLSL